MLRKSFQEEKKKFFDFFRFYRQNFIQIVLIFYTDIPSWTVYLYVACSK